MRYIVTTAESTQASIPNIGAHQVSNMVMRPTRCSNGELLREDRDAEPLTGMRRAPRGGCCLFELPPISIIVGGIIETASTRAATIKKIVPVLLRSNIANFLIGG